MPQPCLGRRHAAGSAGDRGLAGVARLWEEAGENAQAWWNGARGPRCGKDRRVIWSLSTLSWVGTYNEIMGFLLAKKHLADILARLFGSTTA